MQNGFEEYIEAIDLLFVDAFDEAFGAFAKAEALGFAQAAPLREFIEGWLRENPGVAFFENAIFNTDIDESFGFFESCKRAALFTPDAQNHVGDLYFAEEMYGHAFFWYCASALHKNVDAYYSLYFCYRDGLGIEKNDDKAIKYLVKAAENGHPEACYIVGSDLFQDKRYEDAFVFLECSANYGNAYAQYLLSICYIYGYGVDKDNKIGEEWLLLAAEGGHAYAQYLIGALFYERNNHEEAFKWFSASAEQGDPYAQYELSKYCIAMKDYDRAFSLLSASVEQGCDLGIYSLGVCYLGGIGVDKNSSLAYKYIKQAADSGNAEAQYQLAMMYFKGNGVNKSLDNAIYWHGKAHSQGYEESTKALLEIREELVSIIDEITNENCEVAKQRWDRLKQYCNIPISRQDAYELGRTANRIFTEHQNRIEHEINVISPIIKKIDKALGI